ncbi:MAG: hypothetical protein JXK05_05130 [Campylobacterales bacterium]|nr:hypothetical protein [Campylobacterales bacterium]
MRSAFTVVEVVIAAVIATIAGVGLLQMNANYAFLFARMEQKSISSEVLSLVGFHADKKYHKTTKTLEDLLDRTYDIQNDDLRKWLGETKLDYTEHLIETITLGEEELGGDFGNYEMEDASETSALAPVIQFELLEIHVEGETIRGSVLHVRPVTL